MTALSPPISINARPAPGKEIVDTITQSSPHKTSGPIVTFFQAMISLGLLPLVLWPTRWAEFLDNERQDFKDLIAWWRPRVMPDDAAQLDKIAKRFRPRPILIVLPWLAVCFNVVLMATLITQGDAVDRIWDLTFKHAITSQQRHFTSASFPLEHPLYIVWMGSLLLAFGMHWYAVRSHAVAVQSLVKWTNRLGRQHSFAKIKNQALKIGLTPAWIIVGIVMCGMHAWWAIPMIFAGALQRRYSMITSPCILAGLVDQAHSAPTATRTSSERFCRCGSRLPTPAKFCPRCGTAV